MAGKCNEDATNNTFLSFVNNNNNNKRQIPLCDSYGRIPILEISRTYEDHDRTTVSLSYGKALKAARGRGENAKGKL